MKRPVKRPVKRAVKESGPTPEAGGLADSFLIERASATPTRRENARPSPPTITVPTPEALLDSGRQPVRGPLRAVQAWFTEVIMHPESADLGVEGASNAMRSLGATAVEQIVLPGPRMSATERMGVYQYAYHARLVECLKDDYPVLANALGDEAFDRVARQYITAHPSDGPNLNWFGRHFAGFLRECKGLDHRAFLADLARLEWAMVQVIHEGAAPILGLAALSEAGPESWETLTLMRSPTLRVLEFEFPVNRYFQAMRDGKSPRIPTESRSSATAVYRVDYAVWRMDLKPAMAAILTALLEGRTLGDALTSIDAEAEDIMLWFREWVEGGFFSSIGLGSDPGIILSDPRSPSGNG